MTKDIKYIIFVTVCFLIFPFNSKAACGYERVADLSRIAGNVQINYSYDAISGKPEFTVNITNITSDIYVTDNYGAVYENADNAIKYPTGASITYNIYSKDANCLGEKISTKYLQLPHFNIYADDDLCKNNSSELCSMWYDSSTITYDKFVDLLSTNNKTEDNTNDNNTEEPDYLLMITIGVVVILIIGLVIFIIRKIKSRR